jgi:large subunit ribosomal protein L35
MKMKTLSSLKKRIKRSARGKFIHGRAGTSHNNASKSKRRKRGLHSPAVLSGSLAHRVSRLVPYK